MSQKVSIAKVKLERVFDKVSGKAYLRQPLENNVRLRPPTAKEMKKHKKIYRKQVQTLIIRGKYENE
jgi:hypothetical protein